VEHRPIVAERPSGAGNEDAEQPQPTGAERRYRDSVSGRVSGRAGCQAFEFRYDAWCGWLLGALGLGSRWSGVELSDDLLCVRMGWGFRARIPRRSVASVERIERLRWFGWGVHGWGGRWLVNGSMKELIAIQIEPGERGWVLGVPVRLRTIYVSLVDPEPLLAAFSANGLPEDQVRW
jgi:hypothetical protein